jgi:hypothetical protein
MSESNDHDQCEIRVAKVNMAPRGMLKADIR